ncbi:MAG: winged helix-turn-helix transcriptional regulator [Ilumatobacteraceae bacterium]
MTHPDTTPESPVAADAGPSYGQYCPISRALDVLGERWSLMILRDMILGATRFNEIARGLPGLSRTLLVKRLRQFERAHIVEHVDGEYHLTEAGRDLEPLVFSFGEWGARWIFGDPNPAELDAQLLAWWMHDRLDIDILSGVLASERQVLHLRFSDDPRWFWIVVDHGMPSVCDSDPGFEVDVTLRSDLSTLYQVWLGRIPISEALRSGRLTIDGSRAMKEALPRVLKLSQAAPLVSAAAAQKE